MNITVDFSMNDNVTIYPNLSGKDRIRELIEVYYELSSKEAHEMFVSHLEDDGGYTDQLWVIISMFHSMFYNGQNYFSTTKIGIVPDKN